MTRHLGNASTSIKATVSTTMRFWESKHMEEQSGPIDYKAVVDQLQAENETLRERLTDAVRSGSPISEAIDGVVVVLKTSDPMKLYLWACIVCICITAVVQIIEVVFK